MTTQDQSGVPAKQGLPTIAWIGIGCAGLLLVAVIVVVVGGLFVARKVSDVAGDFQDNPVRTVATVIDKLNPDIEVVEVDEDKGTITVRQLSSGETVTVNWEDAKEGRISFSTGDKEVTFSADGDDGQIHITADEGEDRKFSLTTGEDGGGEAPDWVPRYPGVEVTGGATMQGPDGISGGFTLEPDADVDQIADFYRSELKKAGFELNISTFSNQGGATGAIINGVADTRNCTIHIAHEDDKTTVAVSYSEEVR